MKWSSSITKLFNLKKGQNLEKEHNLGCKYNSTTSLFNLLLSNLWNKLGLDNNGLLVRQNPLAKYLEVTELSNINHGHSILGCLVFDILGDHGPELVDVDDGTVELVAELVEVTHTNLTEVTRMVFVEEDPVVVHASCISTTSGMLPVLSNPTMTCAHVTSLLPILLEACSHFGVWRRGICCLGCWAAAQQLVRERPRGELSFRVWGIYIGDWVFSVDGFVL